MEILDKVKSFLPKDTISKMELEGSEIIVYVKDKKFFLEFEPTVREIVSHLKKRIEIRAAHQLLHDQEYVKKKIHETVSPDAKIKDIYFEHERSLVIISAEKPA